jgi:hypothetical protein
MKTRQGFVSNSSSASFIIAKRHLTEDQIDKVIHYNKYMENFNPSWDYWSIFDNGVEIEGDTIMDNIDMDEYLESIGIDLKTVHYNYH